MVLVMAREKFCQRVDIFGFSETKDVGLNVGLNAGEYGFEGGFECGLNEEVGAGVCTVDL